MMIEGQAPVLIFLFPFLASLIVPFFRSNRLISQGISGVALVGSAASSFIGLWTVRYGNTIRYAMGGWLSPYGIEWYLDGFSALMALLVSVIAFTTIISTGKTVDQEIGQSQVLYYMIVLLHVSGLMGMVLTHDLFNLFVFLEVASLTGYALVASGNQWKGNVASFRYLLIGTVGASFYLLGVGYLYAVTGTLNMSDMASRLPHVLASRSVFLGVLLILIGLAIKMGLFPFHGWLPDAYTHASDSATALIAPIMTKVAIYSFIRIAFWTFGGQLLADYGMATILIILGASATIAGSIMAFMQKDFKRMLAYSSISHIGLIMMAFGVNHRTAFVGAILHIIHHATMKTALFLIAASAAHQHSIRNIFDFSKLRGQMPYTMMAFAVAALSMIGIPPLCGFFSKWYMVVGALRAGSPLVAFLIVASSLLTALYFFKVIEKGFFVPSPVKPRFEEAPTSLVLSTTFLALAIFLLGIAAPWIYTWGIKILPPWGA